MSKQILSPDCKMSGTLKQEIFNPTEVQPISGRKPYKTKDFSRETGIETRFNKNCIKLFHLRRLIIIPDLKIQSRGSTARKAIKNLRYFIYKKGSLPYITKLIRSLINIRKMEIRIDIPDRITNFVYLMKRYLGKYTESILLSIKGVNQKNIEAFGLAHVFRKHIRLKCINYRAFYSEYHEMDLKAYNYVSRLFASLTKLESLHWEPVLPTYYSKLNEKLKVIKPLVAMSQEIKNLFYVVHMLNDQYYDCVATWMSKVALMTNVRCLKLTIKQFFKGVFPTNFKEGLSNIIGMVANLETLYLEIISTEVCHLDMKVFENLSKKTNLKTMILKFAGIRIKDEDLPSFADELKYLTSLQTLVLDFNRVDTVISGKYLDPLGNSLKQMKNLSRLAMYSPYDEVIGINEMAKHYKDFPKLQSLSLQIIISENYLEDAETLLNILIEQDSLKSLSIGINSLALNPSLSPLTERDIRLGTMSNKMAGIIINLIASYTLLEDLTIILGDLIDVNADEVNFSKIFGSCINLRRMELNFGKNFLNDVQVRESCKNINSHSKLRDLSIRGNFSQLSDDMFNEFIEFVLKSKQTLDLDIIPAGLNRKKKNELAGAIQKVKEAKSLRL